MASATKEIIATQVGEPVSMTCVESGYAIEAYGATRVPRILRGMLAATRP